MKNNSEIDREYIVGDFELEVMKEGFNRNSRVGLLHSTGKDKMCVYTG